MQCKYILEYVKYALRAALYQYLVVYRFGALKKNLGLMDNFE